LAGELPFLTKKEDEESQYYSINTLGTKNLLQAAAQKKVRKFIFFSTVKVYGSTNEKAGKLITEETIPIPDTLYGQSKFDAEKMVISGEYVKDSTILRLCAVYGPEGRRGLYKLINVLSKGIPLLFPEVYNKRSMVDIRDVIKAAILVAESEKSKQKIYIVSDGNFYSTAQIISLISLALNKKGTKIVFPLSFLKFLAKLGDLIGIVCRSNFPFNSYVLSKIISSAPFSSNKIKKELSFFPEFDIPKSLPDMIAFYKSSNGRCQQQR
jgi:nucleoside-diphosphate-sugar epimerase